MAKRVIIDLGDDFDDVLALTAVGVSVLETRVHCVSMNLAKHCYIRINTGADDNVYVEKCANEEATHGI